MKAMWSLAGGVLVSLGWTLLGAAGQPPPAASSTQDLLFLGDSRPVLLRLDVQVGGRPFRDVWAEYLQKLFADLDRDGNASLSPTEAERVPSPDFLQALFQGELHAETATRMVPFAVLDADHDDRVTAQELGAFYRRAELAALVFQAVSQQTDVEGVTEALFYLLDRNRNGRLDAFELTDAADVLHKVDLDEDELITPKELLRRRPARTGALPVMPPTPARLGFWMVLTGESAAPLAQVLLQRYDRDRDGQLRAAESGLDPAAFAALDRDGNGTLDAGELARFGAGLPDRELLVRVDDPPSPQPGKGVQQTAQKTRALALGNALVELHVGTTGAGNFLSLRQFYLQRFQVADADRRGYLERQQAEESSYLNGLFALADRDRDGKLSTSELSGFLDLHAQGARSFTTLTVVDQSLPLLGLLDTDPDGQLSLRELSSAWARLRSYDRDGDGTVSREELPRQYQLALVRGWSKPGPLPRSATASTGRVARGPLWFRNMDVNGDGEVSRREFLGSAEVFRRLDTDGNGLIRLEEAKHADALHPEKQGPQPAPDRR